MGKDEGIPVPSTLSSASAESIELFKEDQAFLRSNDLAPPPLTPLSRQQVLSLSRSSCVSPVELTNGEGGGEGGGRS
jgi:hypothetical protein